jgi:hypothetical protein
MLIGSSVVQAEGFRSPHEGKAAAKKLTRELVVTSATVDRENETVTLRGFNFGSRKPYVYCETQLMKVQRTSDEEIVVEFPASEIEDGTYLFTVIRNSVLPSRGTFYVTTIAAASGGGTGTEGPAGPQGPAGPAGADGTQGSEGPAGPAGAAGAQGPQGPQGPEGPAGANGVSGYEKVLGDTGEFPFDQGDFYSVYASCPAGKSVVGGGHELLLDGARLTVVASMPYDDAGFGWRVDFRNDTTGGLARTQVRAYAICVNVQ